ncbi:hypothetical protein [Amycolatopsis sp. cmx-11-51]|uniref:hypothetical protein n=1 Tax=Amycolatopsis sp. cmx-11-51 TaxID=2785797 RepID=UPI0039E53EF4
MSADTPAAKILANGSATIALTGNAATALAALRTEAAHFFTQDQAVKCRHGSSDFNFGFRPFGRQYSVTPDRLDLNESFTYWADDPSTVPDSSQIAPLMHALGAYWTVVAGITENILHALATHYDYPHPPLAFHGSSYIEVNWYRQDGTRDLMQDRHEDGHLLTIAAPDSPGLEIETAEGMGPASTSSNEVLVMPGSLLTAMTAGDVPPLYHQVRNHQLSRRTTVLFLVNPPLDQLVRPVCPGCTGDRHSRYGLRQRSHVRAATRAGDTCGAANVRTGGIMPTRAQTPRGAHG